MAPGFVEPRIHLGIRLGVITMAIPHVVALTISATQDAGDHLVITSLVSKVVVIRGRRL